MRTPDEIRDDAISYFCEVAIPKFDAGQLEHGGSLDERVSAEDIEDEIIDLWMYVQSMKKKHQTEMETLRAEAERWKERAQR